jgi:hypothetical protein
MPSLPGVSHNRMYASPFLAVASITEILINIIRRGYNSVLILHVRMRSRVNVAW